MPQRFLRPGITNSELWNGVSWPAQSLFIRLLTLVDDYGRCDGRTPVVLGGCFSMWNSLNPNQSCNLQQVEQMLQQLAAKKLVEIYESDGKTVLQVSQWQERIREGVKEKWPSKPKLAATCSNLLPSSPSSPPSSPPSPAPSVPERERHFPECNGHPTLKEVLAVADIQGLAPWKATDWFNEMEGCGWLDHLKRPIQNWQAVLTRVKVKWESDGRPNGPPISRSNQNRPEVKTASDADSLQLQIVRDALRNPVL